MASSREVREERMDFRDIWREEFVGIGDGWDWKCV